MKIAAVALAQTAYGFDRLYDYLIPEGVSADTLKGCRVFVSFGAGSKQRQGVVFDVRDAQPDRKLKPILQVLDPAPILREELLLLAEWMAEHTFCTLYDAVRAMVPAGLLFRTVETYRLSPGLEDSEPLSVTQQERQILDVLRQRDDFMEEDALYKKAGLPPESGAVQSLYGKGFLMRNTNTVRRMGDATQRIARLRADFDPEDPEVKLTAKQKLVVAFLANSASATVREICYYTGVTAVVVENLHRMGVVDYEQVQVRRTPAGAELEKRYDAPEQALNAQQQAAYDRLNEMRAGARGETALLYGVTGSGKTRVYMKLIDEKPRDTGAIVLVPEIALTPQLLAMFRARYGSRVAVLHSGLSVGERMDEWKRIRAFDADIVVGTRSAVFAPFEKLSLIVVDEEQESSYKSEMSPRYDAVQVARFRCAYHKSLLVLSSATPSVQTFAMAKSGRYALTRLSGRYGGASLPQVITADLADRDPTDGFQTLTPVLRGALDDNLRAGKQSILLINRRGFNTFISCTRCRKVMTCPNCSISLTYHSANNRLMCHYCGYSRGLTTVCPACGGDTARFAGFGTQKVEQELETAFPDARVLRMDADTTSGKDAHTQKLGAFARGDYDILIGTQMVAKGLDFPNVTLVGVISVDQQLYNDDFRSAERTFSLLTQVVGRAGRGQDAGRAVIQTMEPENELIALAAGQDYDAFFETELRIRKAMIYPPYCDLCVVGLSGVSEKHVHDAAGAFLHMLRERIDARDDVKVIILGPVSPRVAKVGGRYRERLILKCRFDAPFRAVMADCLKVFSNNKRYNTIRIYADVNPESVF